MQWLVDADLRLLERSDELLEEFSDRNFHAPAMLRELTTFKVGSLVLLTIASLFGPFSVVISPILVGFTATYGAMAMQRWRSFAVDARRDWSISLMEKYAARALRRRENDFLFRVMGLVTLPSILFNCILIWSIVGWDVFVFAIFVVGLVHLVGSYMEGGTPLPPNERRRSRSRIGVLLPNGSG